jgi:hypothetical protein
LTLVFTSQGSKIEGQKRVAEISYIRHQTSSRSSGSTASGFMASGSTASRSTALGASVSAATTVICSCQSEWQTQDKQIKALHEEAAEA